MPRLETLDALGIRNITDKCSLSHDFLRKYERLFAPFRDLPITLLEIGVFDGGSLQVWEDYFQRATIVGLDIRPECKQFEGGRRIVEIVSQADAGAMKAIGQKYRPHIVIDDGSHQADHILISFEALYPHLGDDGLYIIEDLFFHTGWNAERYRGSAAISPQRYFLNLANRVALPDDDAEFDRELAWSTESVEFALGFAAVRKRGLPNPDHISTRRALVEQVDSHRLWGWFSSYVLNNGGSKDEAIACARRALAGAPTDLEHKIELSWALERAGKPAEAMAVIDEARRAEPNNPYLMDRKATLSAKLASTVE